MGRPATGNLEAADLRPAYLEQEGERLYSVLHPARGTRRAGLLLAGPFGAERERSYLTGVHWARRMAARGFDVLRFDYRGVGESGGDFEAMSFPDWTRDVAAAARALRPPLVLHGLRLGGLLAAELFAQGLGDGLLLWAPTPSARDHLWELLRRNVTTEMVLRPERRPKPREAYAAELEAGGRVVVDGYVWTRRLWRESEGLGLRLPEASEARPWLRLEGPRFWESGTRLMPDTTRLFEASQAWLESIA